MPHEIVSVDWEGRPVEAFAPAPLAELDPIGSSSLVEAARATGVLSTFAVRHDSRGEVTARLLLRAEGVASSRIEAIDAPAEWVAVADMDQSATGPAAEVVGNLRALDAALAHKGPLTRKDLWRWHRILMKSSSLDDKLKGAWRDRLGWIGGPRRTRHLGALVRQHS